MRIQKILSFLTYPGKNAEEQPEIVCMDCLGWVGHMIYRVAVVSNGIGRL